MWSGLGFKRVFFYCISVIWFIIEVSRYLLIKVDAFRFLQAEAETLQQLQAKISNELHHLQVRVNPDLEMR